MFPTVAGGNISPHRFVKPSTTADHTVLQAGAGEKVVGISQRGTRNVPYSSLDDGYAAIAGESLRVYSTGETCLVECGGTVTPGDRLKADSNGKAVVASSGDEYGAIAGQAGTSGKLVEVYVDLGKIP